jgi:hypothetical protein
MLNNTYALTQDAEVIPFMVEITGDVVASGSITASSAIVNGLNINTTLADILSRLNALENP